MQEEKERHFHESRASFDEMVKAKDHEIHVSTQIMYMYVGQVLYSHIVKCIHLLRKEVSTLTVRHIQCVLYLEL